MVVIEGERYLVSMLGAESDWVQNVKAACGNVTLRHGRREEVHLEEVAADRRAPVLRAYLKRAPGARPHLPVDAAFGKRFRLYSIATFALLLLFGALTGLEAPRIAANLPTPWVGIWERINIGVFLLWVVALATALLRAPVEQPHDGLGGRSEPR